MNSIQYMNLWRTDGNTNIQTHYHIVKFLNFRMPENFAVIYLILKKRGQTLGYFIKMVQMD